MDNPKRDLTKFLSMQANSNVNENVENRKRQRRLPVTFHLKVGILAYSKSAFCIGIVFCGH